MKAFVFLSVICFFLSCNAQNVEQAQKEAPATSSISQPQEIPATNWPTPNRYLEGIPVYEKFADIEPMFQPDNDTTYVINFWATWCKPCVKELPYFEALTKAHQKDKVKVVLVSLDFPKQLESKLVPFVQENKLQSTVVVLLDGKYNDWIDKVATEWSGAIPVTLFTQGEKRHFLGTSVESTEELETILDGFDI